MPLDEAQHGLSFPALSSAAKYSSCCHQIEGARGLNRKRCCYRLTSQAIRTQLGSAVGPYLKKSADTRTHANATPPPCITNFGTPFLVRSAARVLCRFSAATRCSDFLPLVSIGRIRRSHFPPRILHSLHSTTRCRVTLNVVRWRDDADAPLMETSTRFLISKYGERF